MVRCTGGKYRVARLSRAATHTTCYLTINQCRVIFTGTFSLKKKRIKSYRFSIYSQGRILWGNNEDHTAHVAQERG